MYELSRVRLFSIGPAGARYSDVLLDLSEVGAPVRAPKQEALFGHTPYDVPRRPSPASVLFLENGGGKSVLMKLIFSVMLPGRRQVVGTTNTRVLEKFVRAGDVAHVLLEWQHVQTGARIVTGKVSEWRGHVVSTDPAKLTDAWYSFRPTPRLDLDSLPFTDNGRLVTLSGFHERLNEAHRTEPGLGLMWTSGQSDWTAHLTGLGLDPELFRYQRAMNAGEGEAAEAFTFRSDDAFVDFLLRAVVDEEDPRGLAEVVAGYADKLAQRGTLGAERDFVSGALDRLTPLADKESQAAAARGLTTEARKRAQRFRAAVALRHETETAALAVAEARLAELTAQEQTTDRDAARLFAIVQELRRLVAGMRLREALDEKDALEARLDEAKTAVAAWRETETLLTCMSATNRAEGLRLLVGEQEQAARPALEARNAAARALARGLLATAERADADAAQSLRRAEALRAQEKTVNAERDEHLNAAAGHTERARGLSDRIAETRATIATGVRAGLLADGADVAAESRQAEATAEAAGQQFTDALAERDRLAADTANATDAIYAARRAEDTAAAAATRADELCRAAEQRTASLAAQPRLAELLGADRVELDDDLPELSQLLADALAAAEQRVTELRIADAADRRALAALGDGGLLPAAEDVAATVAALAEAGITAWPGWRYLSTTPAAGREALLRSVPHLIDGVVLNDAALLDRARDVLTAARLLPRSIVAVGCTADFSPAAATPAGPAFLVPPNPAMFDEEQAEAERVAIDGRHRRRQAELHTLTTQLAADRDLSDRLQRFRADFPAGTLTRLRGDREDAARAAAETGAKVAAAEGWRTTAKATEDELRFRTPELKAEADRLWQRAAKLAELAGVVAHLDRWHADAAAAQESARASAADAERAAGQADILRERAETAVREADDHRRTAHACRQELRDVPGGGSADESDPAPTEPLDVLRAAARAAADAYAKVEVGGNLRAELEQADNAESVARAKLAALRPAIRDLASALLSTPDGSDPAARAAAAERAERKVLTLDAELIRASAQVGALDAAVKQFTARERSLEPYGKPQDIESGEDLVARAEDDLAAARARHEHVHTARVAAESGVARAHDNCTGFRGVLDSLHGAAAGAELSDEAVEPFGGDSDFARSRRDDIWASLDDAEKLLSHAESQMRSAADELAQYAAESQFEHVTSPVRRQMVKVRRDELPGYAAEWERALRPRLRSLDDDLAQIGRHRSVIVERLTGMVSGALRVLRAAQRLSMLPDGLGNWSGQEFLRMRFADVEESVLAERLGEVIDEVAAADKNNTAKSDGAGKRDGMNLLLRGVHAAVPKGFRVEMLKPDAVLRTERLRVSEIRDVFSGGQQLTAAIILYCTMAALRANDRGKTGHRHSGVLFLDNPIGRASAGYLLELQLAVADALGVQLVYTTGLFDSSALSVFPLIIRLRNDADLRAGLKYLSVDSIVRKELAGIGDSDEIAQLGATRMFLRPPAPDSAAAPDTTSISAS